MHSPAPEAGTRPLASVIVLGYNGRDYIEDCLSSALDQDLPRSEYEVLYVDNGSNDGSAAFARERFPQLQLLALDRNYGYAEGNNIAFRQTRGEFVVFLNQDTVVHPSWLRELIDGLRQSAPDVMAGHANIIQPWYPEFAGIQERASVDTAYTAEVNRLGYVRYRRLPSAERPVDTLFLHGVCIIVRRSLIDELGYAFDPDFFAYAEDLDLGLRVRALGYRSIVIPRALVYHKHTLQASISWGTAVKTVRIIRNRFLAFFKVMSGWELVLMAPLVVIGAPMNASEFGLGRYRRLLYGRAQIQVTRAPQPGTLYHMPRFLAKRRRIRATTATPTDWCLRALWRRSPA